MTWWTRALCPQGKVRVLGGKWIYVELGLDALHLAKAFDHQEPWRVIIH